MANNKDRPQVWRSYGTGTGGYRRLEPMNERELAAREALQQPYNAMLARQQAYEAKLQPASEPNPAPVVGCVFAKSCNLPDAIISYNTPSGYIPLDRLADYGEHAVLGGRETDATGRLPLQKISATVLPAGLGSLALGGSAITGAAAATGTVATGFMLGLVALLWPSTLGDSALYSDEQLRTLTRARTRVRLNIEQQADGSLKGYAFYTGKNRDWEMVDVVQFQLQGTQHVADLGDGVELIWTPAVDPADTLGIPALEAAPATPHIWVYPPTETAASIIVDPIYPPEYKDFILVFPSESGVKPLYIVVSWKYEDAPYHGKKGNSVKSKRPTNGLAALNDSIQVKPTEPRRVGIDPQTKEFVVIDRTTDELYHGHVRSWEELHQDMKNALIKAGKTNRKGKILGAEK
ncbi:S-type pyocin domain-containing protein [Pseudomonas hygromyciniae]|uniref:S-type pyocin domain-containing protein n=1 Tax=Pseudomonas hygromyciniae TaxID=2812000 RepID=A0ABX7K4S6_9PSED|nr:S-type pyocin domain-containing protein [Pseudomonas hygromyciniae]MBN0980112.1 S-type pyocin domain-containing protein [Pseudomonas hygromyciniae]QSB40941.1 S-type pyocin domain-containing protein [Pseudomonas hygromyciniae]